MQSVIIRTNAAGIRRPELIDSSEAEAMVARGEAVIHRRNQKATLYEAKVVTAAKAADPDDEGEDEGEDTPQVYATKDMMAQPGRRRRRQQR